MKTLKLVPILTLALASLWSIDSWALSWLPNPGHDFETRKVNLGETLLMNGHDADFLPIRGGKVCGLTHFQLGVRGDGAVIDDLKVVFGNGTIQDIAVRERFPAGTNSRWVDLAGDERCIQGVYINGRSFSQRPRQSRIVFFGLQDNDQDDTNRRAELIGATSLTNGPDLDLIDLRRPACGLTKFKIRVRGDSARIDYLLVQFGNGQTQQINVRQNFAPGTESLWKDLEGNERCIDKVFVAGKSGSGRPRQSIVEFWGFNPR